MTNSFTLPSGLAVPAVTAHQMLEVDRVAVEETGPNLYQMMENAGRNLATFVKARNPEGPVLVLSGTGGNGGGALCAARHLANHGLDVAVAVTAVDRLGDVPRAQLHTFEETPGRLVTVADVGAVDSELVVDGLIGYSLTGAPTGIAADLISWINESSARVVSLDVPSGLDATHGETPGVVVEADNVVTLALPKSGLGVVGVGIWLADIGIPAGAFARAGVTVPDRLYAGGYLQPLALTSHGSMRDEEVAV